MAVTGINFFGFVFMPGQGKVVMGVKAVGLLVPVTSRLGSARLLMHLQSGAKVTSWVTTHQVSHVKSSQFVKST